MNRSIHTEHLPNPHEDEICESGKSEFIESERTDMPSSKSLAKIRDFMETALGHDNFSVNVRDYKQTINRKIIDADIDIFFTDRTLEKRFVFYDGTIVGVKDRDL